MKPRVLISAIAVVLLATAVGCFPDPPPAESTVDQSYSPALDSCDNALRTNDSFGQSAYFAQSFTAGRTGELDRVSAVLMPRRGPVVPVTVSIETTAGGRPSGVVIGQGVWNGPASPDLTTFVDIDLSTPAPVTAGRSMRWCSRTLPAAPSRSAAARSMTTPATAEGKDVREVHSPDLVRQPLCGPAVPDLGSLRVELSGFPTPRRWEPAGLAGRHSDVQRSRESRCVQSRGR